MENPKDMTLLGGGKEDNDEDDYTEWVKFAEATGFSISVLKDLLKAAHKHGIMVGRRRGREWSAKMAYDMERLWNVSNGEKIARAIRTGIIK